MLKYNMKEFEIYFNDYKKRFFILCSKMLEVIIYKIVFFKVCWYIWYLLKVYNVLRILWNFIFIIIFRLYVKIIKNILIFYWYGDIKKKWLVVIMIYLLC